MRMESKLNAMYSSKIYTREHMRETCERHARDNHERAKERQVNHTYMQHKENHVRATTTNEATIMRLYGIKHASK